MAVRFGKVGMKPGLRSIFIDRVADESHRHAHLASLNCQRTEHAQRMGIARLDLQNLPIDLFGLDQLARLVMTNGGRQGFVNSDHNAKSLRMPRGEIAAMEPGDDASVASIKVAIYSS